MGGCGRGAGGGGKGGRGWEGWNCGIMGRVIMKLFSLLHFAASLTVYVHYFCVCIVSCHRYRLFA